MSGRRFTRWVLPLLMLGVLLLLLLLILYPTRAQQRPELLEMSVISREAEGSAWATARQGMEQAAADLNVELRFLYPAQSDSAQEQGQLLRREVESGASAILLFPADRETLAETMFRHTTTLGVRESVCRRHVLARELETLDTPWGPVRRKTSGGYGVSRAKYEYEDLARIARERGIGLDQARNLVEGGE